MRIGPRSIGKLQRKLLLTITPETSAHGFLRYARIAPRINSRFKICDARMRRATSHASSHVACEMAVKSSQRSFLKNKSKKIKMNSFFKLFVIISIYIFIITNVILNFLDFFNFAIFSPAINHKF